MPLILGTNSIKDTGYDVANSLRFNQPSSDFLNITPSGAGNRRTFTFSAWVKRSNSINFGGIFTAWSADSSGNYFAIRFDSDKLTVTTWGTTFRKTNRVFRDKSAWYHIVVAVDTTDGTADNRIKIYVNGVQETSFQTNNSISQNTDTPVNNTNIHTIGTNYYTSASQYAFDGYIAEAVLIDGQALDPTSFGEFDEDSGIWKPINVSGLTFGTNGFYLDFENSGSLGVDVSGNGNNFTVNNLTSIDQSTDTCTNNFATWNPLDNFYFQANYFKDGNLHIRSDGSSYSFLRSTFGVSTGKWYWEVEFDAQQQGAYSIIGIESKAPTSATQGVGDTTNGYGYYADNGNVRTNNGNVGGWSGSTYAVGDIVGVALDLDNNKLYFSKNGTFQNSGDPTSGSTGTGAVSITAPSSTSSGFYFPSITFYDATGKGTFKANFGSPMESISSGNSDGNGYGNFEYSVPSGYYALNTKNLSEFG